jgi:hypothetical protein
MARPTLPELLGLKLKPTKNAIIKDDSGLRIGPANDKNAVARLYRGNDGKAYSGTPTAPLGKGPYDTSVGRFFQENNIRGDPANAIHRAPMEPKRVHHERIISPLYQTGLPRDDVNHAARSLQELASKTKSTKCNVGYGINEAPYRIAVQGGAYRKSRGMNISDYAREQELPANYEKHVQEYQRIIDRDRSAVAKFKKFLWQGFLSSIILGAIYLGYNQISKADPVMAANQPAINHVNPDLVAAVEQTYGPHTIRNGDIYFMIEEQLTRIPVHCDPSVVQRDIGFIVNLDGTDYSGVEYNCYEPEYSPKHEPEEIMTNYQPTVTPQIIPEVKASGNPDITKDYGLILTTAFMGLVGAFFAGYKALRKN